MYISFIITIFTISITNKPITMTYSHENITLNVTTLNPQWVDMMGETTLTLNSEFVAELIENSCTFTEFFLGFECYELKEEFEDDEDAIINHFNFLNEKVEVRNADAIIAVYEYCLNEKRQFNFDVETENVSWVIHDILHAIHDAAGCTIYVASDIERERILKSLEITQEQFPNEVPNWEFLDNLESEFYNRFNQSLCLEEFKHSEYEEEY